MVEKIDHDLIYDILGKLFATSLPRAFGTDILYIINEAMVKGFSDSIEEVEYRCVIVGERRLFRWNSKSMYS